MKTLSFILIISIFFMPEVGFGQSDLKVENDDLYFTSDDRKVLNEKIALEEKRQAEELKKSGYAYNQFESSNEGLNDFKNNEKKQNAELNQEPPIAEQSEEGWYYDENAARRGLNPQNGQRNGQTQIYNYYGGMNPMMMGWNDPWMFGGMNPVMYGGFYDPFMFRPGFNVGFGFNSWRGSYWSVGYGRGFYDPFFYDPFFYDPFFDPYWGSPFAYRNPWRRPFWGGGSYGWGYRNGFYDGYNAGLYNGVFVDNNSNRRTRTYTNTSRISRSAANARIASGRTRNLNNNYSVSRNVGTERSRSAVQVADRTSRASNVSSRTNATARTANNATNSIYSRTSRTAQYARSTSDNNVRTASYSGNRGRAVTNNASNVSRTNSGANNSSRYYNSSRTNRTTYSSGRSYSNNRSATFGNSSSRSSSSFGRSSGSSRSSSYGRSSNSSSRSSSYGRSSSSSRGSSSYGRSSSSSSRSSGSSSRSSGSSRSSSSSRGGRGG
jgi:hypothetical protein